MRSSKEVPGDGISICGSYPLSTCTGMPVESWMLEFEGKLIFHELHPNMIPNPDDVEDGEEDAGSYPIKFSDT